MVGRTRPQMCNCTSGNPWIPGSMSHRPGMTVGGNMQAELNKVVSALGEFYARESYLFERDLGEHTLTHRLAVHLEKQFPGWDVDCDYNRLGERTLRLPHG